MEHATDARLIALHGLRLRGAAEAGALAEHLDADEGAVAEALEQLDREGLVSYRPGPLGGWSLTPPGRDVGAALVRDRLARSGREDELRARYDEFRPHNRELLAICTDWQLRSTPDGPVRNDHTDPEWDAGVLARLHRCHDGVEPVLERMADIEPRIAIHLRSLRYALDRVDAGEYEYVTKSMFPSYHSVWFELHEDLLVTLGIERLDEGSS